MVSRFCRDVDAVLMTDAGPMVTTVTWCGRTGAGTMTVAWCVGAGGVAGAKTCWIGATDYCHETDRDCVTGMHNAIVCFWLRSSKSHNTIYMFYRSPLSFYIFGVWYGKEYIVTRGAFCSVFNQILVLNICFKLLKNIKTYCDITADGAFRKDSISRFCFHLK